MKGKRLTLTSFNLDRSDRSAESYVNRCTLTYKRLNGNTPEYINDLLIRNSDTHNRSTRFCNINLMCARFKRSTEGGQAFAVRTTKEWNKLSVDIKQSTSVKSFKHSLFKIILDNHILSKLQYRSKGLQHLHVRKMRVVCVDTAWSLRGHCVDTAWSLRGHCV